MLYSAIKKSSLFSKWLALFAVLELFSYLAWLKPENAWVYLLFLAIISIFLIVKNPLWFLYLPLAEIFWGSLGHSFNYYFISTRLLIFLLVIFIFLYKNINNLKNLKLFKDRILFRIFFILCLTVAGDIIWGYYQTIDLKKVFLDANAYFYILYLPVWYQVYERKYLAEIFEILKAAAIVIALKTLWLLNIFSQAYEWLNINYIYKWVRDSRTGEITPFPNSFFRIFMQSQFYLILAWFLMITKQFDNFKNKQYISWSSLLAAALLVSLSRSFWLGCFLGLLFILINIFVYQRIIFRWSIFLKLIIIAFLAIFLVELSYNLPIYRSINIFTQRSTDSSEAAFSSRSQLLMPLWQNILKQPLWGYGFAKEITYQSNDPRIKNDNNPSGWYTTYAFEWGWLDQWLKGGAILISIFIIWIYHLYRRIYTYVKKEPLMAISFLATLTSLIIIHVFTPYLNHPLGLSFLLLTSIIFIPYDQNTADSNS